MSLQTYLGISAVSTNVSRPKQKLETCLAISFSSTAKVHRVNGQLVAFSVLDIIPGCVSSVYFVWDPDFAWASLGKVILAP